MTFRLFMKERQCDMDMAAGFTKLDANKMIEASRNWNLANDVELLKCLEQVSQDLVNNVSMTLNSMDNLEDSLNETFLRVRTVANKFQAIADNQFIENRVQEEDDFVLARDNEKITEECQISADTSKTQLLESIKDCQIALSKKFETIPLSGIDSEDEMTNSSSVVLIPKNVYKERRLPHLIGGEQFIADETLGLVSSDRFNDDSIESDEDVDETDNISCNSSAVFKNIVDQITTVSSSLPLQKENIIDSTPEIKDSPKLPVIENSQHIQEQPSVPNNFIDNMKEPVVQKEASPSPSKSIKKEESPPPLPATNVSARDQLLAGHQFASFKEDLARVLSGGKPYKKQSTSESENSSGNVSSPSFVAHQHTQVSDSYTENQPSSNTDHRTVTDNSPPLNFAPKSLPISTHGISTSVNPNSVTLPNVSTNVLESLSKGRAKVKGKRRPPSRKHRQANVDGGGVSPVTQDSTHSLSGTMHSEDASIHDSASTQPGSNILSPATDEEDLFVLPAFDLPSDPPNRGIFFGDSLLSPGSTIDDAGVSSSSLFPTSVPIEQASISPRSEKDSISAHLSPQNNLFEDAPKRDNVIGTIHSTHSTNRETSKSIFNYNKDLQGDLFGDVSKNVTQTSESEATKVPEDFEHDFDLFSEVGLTKNSSIDIFSSEHSEKKISSSPPLFADWDETPSIKKTDKVRSLNSQRSGLKWDLLGTDDLSEDLFRSQKTGSTSSSEPKESKTTKIDSVPKNEKSIFASEKSTSRMFFDDDNSFSGNNLFSDSNSFMGLSLPSNREKSLFASDDEDDDDSLFKSAKSITSISSNSASTSTKEGPGTNKISIVHSSPREPVDDPLSMGRGD